MESPPVSITVATNLYASGDRSAALQVCKDLLQLQPGNLAALNLAGACSHSLRALGDARTYWNEAIRMAPANSELRSNLGVLLQEVGEYQEAEHHLRVAIELQPDNAAAYFNLSRLCGSLDREVESEALCRSALAIRPDYLLAHFNLAGLLGKQRRFVESRIGYENVLRINPNHAETHFGLGNLHVEEKNHSLAESHYRDALRLAPGHAGARFNLGLVLLTMGRFSEGWPLHEARFCDPHYVLPQPGCPKWSGESLRGKAILVWQERGFGDEIQFVRFLHGLRKLGARTITLVCKDALKSLFTGSNLGADAVLSEADAGHSAKHHDYWVHTMSLPFLLKTTPASLPARLPYLAASDEGIRRWKLRLPANGIKVGLVWKGVATHGNDANRSLPGLDSLVPLWSVPGIAFISLQKWSGEEEAQHPPHNQPILPLGSEIQDFSDTAAIVSQLDLVICVDTAVAHLAGALGKPCWVLLPHRHTDWRWMESRDDSPWYPSVMRLFRQTDPASWSTTIAAVAAELKGFSPLPLLPDQSFTRRMVRRIAGIWPSRRLRTP